MAGKGRYFDISSNLVPASIDCVEDSPLCTTLSFAGFKVRTVEHLLSALEAGGVDNCRVEFATASNCEDRDVERNDSFLLAFPSLNMHITYEISFPEVLHIGCQWFKSDILDKSFYNAEIASARTFCVYEEVEKMQKAGLSKGGSLENAIVCSVSKGWLNPPLRFPNEPCRHKVLDLIGDLSVYARCGSQGLPVASYVARKAGHALHADFVRHISKTS
ncbi:hypothetical protein V2J09_003479 [Rumex salicifolius]